jgi:hypothetical protein
MTKIKLLNLLRYGAISMLFVLPSLTQAASDGLPGSNLDFDSVVRIFYGLSCWLLSVVGFIVVIFIVLSAFKYMRADSGDKTSEANRTLLYVLIGAIVIFGMPVIMYTVANIAGYDLKVIPFRCKF